MKNKFNFLQIANWLYVCSKNLQILYKNKSISKEELLNKLKNEKKKLLILKDAINKKCTICGIDRNFLSNLENIKKELDIKD